MYNNGLMAGRQQKLMGASQATAGLANLASFLRRNLHVSLHLRWLSLFQLLLIRRDNVGLKLRCRAAAMG